MSIHRACNDFHRTSEAERSRYLGSSLSRREVLLGGLGAGLALYSAQALPLSRVLDAAAQADAAAPDAPVLVCVFLAGGLDLLDTLVPLHDEGRYADLRGATRVIGAPALGTTGLGIHPKLAEGANGGIKGLFERGQVAFLPGIDYANPDMSHFNSRRFWETGVVTRSSATGWLGRWLDRVGSADNALQGLTMSSDLSPLLRSAGAPAAALTALEAVDLPLHPLSRDEQRHAHDALLAIADRMANGHPNEHRAAVARSATQSVDIARRLGGAAPQQASTQTNPAGLLTGSGARGEDSELARKLGVVAKLIGMNLGVRVATVAANGDFDTHSGQQGRIAAQLGTVGRALSQFQAELNAAGVADRVTTLVWSEFGRRPGANRSAGTDHGAGGVAWLQGPRVAGGIATDYPDLRRFDSHGNLAVTVDFRRMYCSLLEQWLGTPAADVIPDAAAFGTAKLIA